MADEIGFELDGKTYPVPELGTFSMDEAQLLWDYSGVAIEDFSTPDPDASREDQRAHEREILGKIRNPAFKRALVEIAVRRKEPDRSWDDVTERVRRANMADVLAAFAEAENVEGDEERPPELEESTPPPSEPSPSESDDSKSNGGENSPNTSDEPDATPASIGASR